MDMNIKNIDPKIAAYIHSYRINNKKKNLKEAIEGICCEHSDCKSGLCDNKEHQEMKK